MSLDEFLARIRSRDVSVVTRCACGTDRRLGELHMCVDCQRTSCVTCSTTEIDTFFCPADLESVPTGTAYGDRNRSQNTADCPLCFCTLATQQRQDGKYCYVCEYCKWASPFAASTPKGLLDAIGERAAEAGQADTFQRLCGAAIAQYKSSTREVDPADMNLDGEATRGHATDVLRAVEKIDESLAERAKPLFRPAAAPVDNSAAAPPAPEWFTAPELDLERVSTLEQRLHGGGGGGSHEVAALLPQNTMLMTKMAYRCPSCNKLTIKPKISAKHVAYDKRRLAIEYLPSFSLSRVERLVPGARVDAVLYATNPSGSAVTVRLEQVRYDEDADERGDDGKEDGGEEAKNGEKAVGSLAVRESDAAAGGAGGEWVVPGREFEIAAFDETEDVLPGTKESVLKDGDEAAGVVYRVRNRAGLLISVNPPPPTMGAARATLRVTVAAADKMRAEFDRVSFLVTLNLGMADVEES